VNCSGSVHPPREATSNSASKVSQSDVPMDETEGTTLLSYESFPSMPSLSFIHEPPSEKLMLHHIRTERARISSEYVQEPAVDHQLEYESIESIRTAWLVLVRNDLMEISNPVPGRKISSSLPVRQHPPFLNPHPLSSQLAHVYLITSSRISMMIKID
jgi:hypothetical protein